MRTAWPLFFTLFLWLAISACENKKNKLTSSEVNPPAKGFNLEASDQKAITIADEVMEAMGGRKTGITPVICVGNSLGEGNWFGINGRAMSGLTTTILLILLISMKIQAMCIKMGQCYRWAKTPFSH